MAKPSGETAFLAGASVCLSQGRSHAERILAIQDAAGWRAARRASGCCKRHVCEGGRLMSQDNKVRIAFIGAGGICEQRHLPNLVTFSEVELTTVCNRSPDSSRRVAEKWKFQRTSDDWRQVSADSCGDEICIGT